MTHNGNVAGALPEKAARADSGSANFQRRAAALLVTNYAGDGYAGRFTDTNQRAIGRITEVKL